MNYNEFIERVKAEIISYLPEEYENASVNVSSVLKNNNVKLDALTIVKKNQIIAPAIYLNDYYSPQMTENDFKRSMDNIAAIRIENDIAPESFKQITDPEKIKNNIVYKLVSYDRNRERLQGMPHRKMNNLALIYEIDISNLPGENATAAITNSMMKKYNMTEKMIHKLAVKNTPRIRPVELKEMLSVLEHEDVSIDIKDSTPLNDGMYILSNSNKLNGAAAILYPNVMKDISKKFENGFYILPSSIHETILVSKFPDMKVSDLEDMIKAVNNEGVEVKEVLSDSAYEYDSDTNSLYLAADHSLVADIKDMQETDSVSETRILQRMIENESMSFEEPDLDTDIEI